MVSLHLESLQGNAEAVPDHNSHMEPESQVLSTESARQLAEGFKNRGGWDPYPHIPCALLSADHVIQYAQRTGMISPLYRGKSWIRMKKASYEGRLGKFAYKYDENGELIAIPVKEKLIVEANSIVFVSCDVHF